MSGYPLDERSEYDGGGVMPNTVHPKGSEALTPSDKLRLQSTTGQETDSRAPVDPYHWYGNVAPEPPTYDELNARIRESRARESSRYKESPHANPRGQY